MSSAGYIDTDPGNDLLNSLEHCLQCLSLARGDPKSWKWCVAAAHSATQTAMLIVLSKAGQYEYLDERSKSRARYIAWLNTLGEGDSKLPGIRVADFMAMYDSCSKYLPVEKLSPERRLVLCRLNSLRNDWTHFNDHGWLIAVAHARAAVRAGVELILDLPLPQPGWFLQEYEQGMRYEITLQALIRSLRAMEIAAGTLEITPAA